MTYDIWTKNDSDHTTELAVHNISNGGVVYHVECLGRSCDDCINNKRIYRVCPECGARVDSAIDQPYICGCGTALWVCGPDNISIVSIYSKPVADLTVKDDTI